MAKSGGESARGAEAVRVRALVVSAFASLPPPAKWALSGSREGDEGETVAAAFARWDHWRQVDAEFLNEQERSGASPLTFLSDEGLRHFLPAYLVADLDGVLDADDGPESCLTMEFTRRRRDEPVNPGRFGARTWGDSGTHRFSVFDGAQANAIVAYLNWKTTTVGDREARDIAEALEAYWLQRSGRRP